MRYTEHDISRSFGFVVQHAMLRSTGDSDMDMWGRERKLFPWVAIAAPLKVSHSAILLQILASRMLSWLAIMLIPF